MRLIYSAAAEGEAAFKKEIGQKIVFFDTLVFGAGAPLDDAAIFHREIEASGAIRPDVSPSPVPTPPHRPGQKINFFWSNFHVAIRP